MPVALFWVRSLTLLPRRSRTHWRVGRGGGPQGEQIDERVNAIGGHFVGHGFSFFVRRQMLRYSLVLEDEKKGLRLPTIPQEEEEEGPEGF